jgi:hypothetical protein
MVLVKHDRLGHADARVFPNEIKLTGRSIYGRVLSNNDTQDFR